MATWKSDHLTALLAGAVAALCYAATVPTGLMGADNAEFATLAVTNGVAHPPGYPLYTLYLRAFAWIPAANAAHAAGLATALLGGATVAMLYLACRAFSFPRKPALLAAALIGADLSVWAVHAHAEVFALNNLIAAAIIWAAAPGSRRGLARTATLGLLAGLGLANHHSIVLLAPIGLWGLWRGMNESGRRALALAVGVVAGLAGLASYLYLWWAATDAVDVLQWGRLETFADLVHHFTRADYGTTQLRPDGVFAPVDQWLAFGRALFLGNLGLVAVTSLVGAVRVRTERLGVLLAVAASFVLSGIVFVGMFNIDPHGIGAQLVSRFYALPIVVLVLLVAAGFERVITEYGRRATIASVIAVLVVAGVTASATLDQYRGVIDAYLRDTLEPLPPDAIVFGTGDHRTLGAAYMQQTQGVRGDVDWVDGQLLAYDWYVERLEVRLDRPLPRTRDQKIPIAEFIAEALATARPVFVANRFVDTIDQLPTYPIGTVIRVLPPGGRPPAPDQLAERNAALLDSYHLDTPLEDVSNPWERECYEYYRRPWHSLAEVFERSGNAEAARRATQLERLYSPQNHGAP